MAEAFGLDLPRFRGGLRAWDQGIWSDGILPSYNPYIEGWIDYYGHFYRTQLRPTLKRIDVYVIRWARRKFKRLRHKTKGARDWFERLRRVNPSLTRDCKDNFYAVFEKPGAK